MHPGGGRVRGLPQRALPKAGVGQLASCFQLAAQGTARASARGRGQFVQWLPPPLGWTPALIRFRTCFHHTFPAPLPTGNPLCLPTCFLPHCEVRACAAVCSPALPWHLPRPILSGVGRRLDSRPARSQLWTGAWPAPPPTPFVSPGRVLLPSGWVSLRVGRRPPSTPPLPLTPAPPVGGPVVRGGRRAPTKNVRARGPAISFPAGAGISGTHRAPPGQDALGTRIHRNQSGCSPKRKGV